MASERTQDKLYFEDLKVGITFTSSSYEMSAERILAFATEFDPQPFHTDPDAAKDTFFAGLAASGWHTSAVTMRLSAAVL
ncbi:MaoC/PaaZ C-terminal domain-containing protein [Pseudomonas sp. 2835]|uniref:MaoC/PaaZ C-terminal domain-containing protein n=1 Tax=Pseudomonas sp. 2835 TaxID=3156451 RepID=UPI003D21D358